MFAVFVFCGLFVVKYRRRGEIMWWESGESTVGKQRDNK